MKTSIGVNDRLRLRLAAVLCPGEPRVALRCGGVLAVAAGTPVARVARACRVSRPTVYHWVRTVERRGVEALIRMGGRH
jgi:transposase-like protein